ncbi:MAG: DNA polymerase III subunit gamma/tau [Candidatus Parcubacteria bacterium]|nr:DNA polymerase III subunit gamma/tau [Candidatus Parcubacteria bacterium]
MSLALYRKYRPQTWQEITGQNHIKITLQHEIESGKVSHAYLFTGPRGIGKTTTARLLAKSINCENHKEGQSEPCNKCDSCLELTAGNDLDILEIDAASHTGVDNVRENIIANARFTPAKRKYKVFIIDEVHMLSISAFNALLKSLEEPPSHAIFILATTEIHKVPATIISRCQRFDFKRIISEELIKRLAWICQQENVKISKKVLTDIARFSEGCLRDAESLLGQILSLGEKEVTDEEASLIIPPTNFNLVMELVNHLVYKNIEASLSLINKIVEDGIDLVQFTDELIEFLRKMILSKISSGLKEFALELDEETEKTIINLAQSFKLNDLFLLINLFSAKKIEIKNAAIAQLPLELAIIEYCSQEGSSFASDDKGKGSGPTSNGKPLDGSKSARSGDQKVPSYAKASASAKATVDRTEDKVKERNGSGVSNTTLKNSNLADREKKVKINLSEIKDKWHNFLVKLQDYNASLVFILKVAEPLELNGNILKIGFKYPFHEQRINQAKVKDSIEEILGEFFNEEIVIETSLLPKDYESEFMKEQTKSDEVELVEEIPNTANGEQQAMIDNLIKTFGGKVVE